MQIHNQIKIAIASGKGGTGKTMVATNFFYSLVKAGVTATLGDCDAEEPNVNLFFNASPYKTKTVTQKVPVIDTDKCVYCGKCSEYCEYNAIFVVPPLKVIKVMDEMCHGCGACSYACEFDAITEKDHPLGEINYFHLSENAHIVESKTFPATLSPVRVINSFTADTGNAEVVIFDSPPGTSCPFIHTAHKADFVVMVTEPTPFGLSNLKQAVDTLKTMNKPCGVIINKQNGIFDELYHYLSIEKIPLLLEIPLEKEIASIYSQGKLITEELPGWQTAFTELYHHITDNHGNSHHQR